MSALATPREPDLPRAPLPTGALTISRITVAGTELELGEVVADVTIRHGRTGYFDTDSASTCQLTLANVDRAISRGFRLGSELRVYATPQGGAEALRFVGSFTDAALDASNLTAIATGRRRTLGDYTVGAGGWPAETWSARVARAFADAGLSSFLVLQADPSFDPQLVARPATAAGADPFTLEQALAELVAELPSLIADRPDGQILVQAIGSRSLAGAVAVDPDEVTYAPSWALQLPEANIVTVTYGDPAVTPQPSVTAQDATSVGLYGPIPVTVATTFVAADDASTLASQILARQAYGRWSGPSVALLYGRAIPIGTPLSVTELPAAAPFDPWQPIVEGWTDSIQAVDGELVWTMDLAVSDPMLSGLALPWNLVPSSYLWNTIDQTVAWRDAVTLGDLEPD